MGGLLEKEVYTDHSIAGPTLTTFFQGGVAYIGWTGTDDRLNVAIVP